nr:GNAT family N-acetyltransferase [Variovorax dokdonensis]
MALGDDQVRRYAPGFPPIAGFADPSHPRLDLLATLVAPGESLYCDGWTGAPPTGWQVQFEAPMLKMIWRGPAPSQDAQLNLVRLGAEYLPQVTTLIDITRPGPFGPRNLDMGEYVGLFEGEGPSGRLVAMAGERSAAGPLREISAVCTHPEMQGRGLARRLILHLVGHQMERGEVPVLNVLSRNAAAIGLYRRMGFEDHLETLVRVIARD